MKIQKDEIISFVQELIEIESINPSLSPQGSGELEIAQNIGRFMEKMGLEVSFQDLGDQRCNVIGTYRSAGKGPSLMLNGHIDTVNVDNMEIAPFEAREKDGKIYGRGSIDMKSGVCAQVMALKSLLDAGIEPAGDVIIACVADEEYASKGTEALVKEFTCDAAIVTEPTNLDIAIAHKGFVWSRLEVAGKAAHGSRPDQGIDAIVHMGRFLGQLDYLEKFVYPQKAHPLLGRASIHASKINGGNAISIYPDSCTLELERRTLPGETLQQVDEELRVMLDILHKEDPQFQAKLETYFERHPLETDKDTKIVQCLTQAWDRSMYGQPNYVGVSFWADSAILSHAGIPTVLFGPKGDGLHSAVEYVEIESLIQCTKILASTILDFCGKKN